jgi:hypothetical protein
MFDDRLLVYFIGSDILLGHLVVVPCDIRFGGILSQMVSNQFLLQKMGLPEASTQMD